MIWKPHVTVAAVLEQDGRFLLVQERVSGKSVYNQPAGHLEDNESLIDAVIRETREESGWQFEPERITGIYRWRQPEQQQTYLRVVFAGRGLAHDPACTLDDGIEGTVWLTAEEIRRQTDRLRSPLVMRSIDDYLAGADFPLTLLADID
ncbi:MAG TPA: NUDIX hydrolase [Gammaproteobacteria bacterium]|nr:NUDIX hydrolase [Gammaproteobacteria bacterium]